MSEQESKMVIAIDAMLPAITEQVAAQLRQRAFDALTYRVNEAVAAEVQRYITENIVPAVTAELEAHRAELIAAVIAGVQASMVALSTATVKHVTDRLTGYDGSKVVGKILGELAPKAY